MKWNSKFGTIFEHFEVPPPTRYYGRRTVGTGPNNPEQYHTNLLGGHTLVKTPKIGWPNTEFLPNMMKVYSYVWLILIMKAILKYLYLHTVLHEYSAWRMIYIIYSILWVASRHIIIIIIMFKYFFLILVTIFQVYSLWIWKSVKVLWIQCCLSMLVIYLLFGMFMFII